MSKPLTDNNDPTTTDRESSTAPDGIDLEPHYTTHQVAEFLQLHQRVVQRIIHRGDLRAVLIAGRYRVPRSALAEYLETQA